MIATAATVLLAAAAWAAPQAPPADPRPGDRGYVLTAIEGDRVERIPLTYLGVQRDSIGPGYDMHLVRLDGPIADRVGVAAGMSGSPVYVDDRLLGALSYRLGSLPTEPIAGVTPIDVMLAAGPATGVGPAGDADRVAPIVTPVAASGLAPDVRRWLAPQLAEHGFVLVSGGSNGSEGAAGAPLVPGSPVAVELLRGDMTLAATGTVTLVDGDRVYAFGHPFLGSGQVEMPMASAEVIHTLADLAGSYKMARTGPEVGAIVEDRLTAIVGSTGRRARMIPLTLHVHGAHYGEQRFTFEVARSSTLSPLIAAVAVANALASNTGFDQEATLLARGTIRFRGEPDLHVETAAAGTLGSDPAIGVAVAVQQTLASLWSNPFHDVDVEAMDLDVIARADIRHYQIEDVRWDRGPVRPGSTLSVDCVLRRYRGGIEVRRMSIPIPTGLEPGSDLILVVGDPDSVDAALGRTTASRLASAEDLPSMIRALGDRRSPHRLTAVLSERGTVVVSRGAAYGQLPPTARRLLGTGRSERRPGLADRERTELELDGPVSGLVAFRVEIDQAGRAEAGPSEQPSEPGVGDGGGADESPQSGSKPRGGGKRGHRGA